MRRSVTNGDGSGVGEPGEEGENGEGRSLKRAKR